MNNSNTARTLPIHMSFNALQDSTDVDFGTDVMTYWGLRHDPIDPDALNFKNPLHHEFLVKTRTINAIRDIRRQFETNEIHSSKIILLVGNRGAGKTTAMRYLSDSIKNMDDTVFVSCYTRPNVNNFNDFHLSIHSSVLTSLRNLLAQKKKIGGSEIIQVSNAISQRNIDLIDDQIGLLFNILCSSYEKRIIFIDNLDKAAPELFGLVRDYFRLQQSFYEQFTNELDTYVFISLQPFIGARFRTDKEVNFLAGKIIKVKPWTEFELDDLLRKRLQKVYTGNFNLDEFFTRPARRLIYTNNEYNPRWSLLAVKRLLKRAYEIFRSKQNQEKRYAIDDYFCRRYYEDMDGVKKGLDISRINFDTLHAQVRNSFKHVYDKIGNVIEIYDDYRYEIVETMVSIYKNEEYLEDQASLNKLENAGLIQTLHGRYNLSQDIIKLFKFIDENVNGNSSYFKYYLLQFLT